MKRNYIMRDNLNNYIINESWPWVGEASSQTTEGEQRGSEEEERDSTLTGAAAATQLVSGGDTGEVSTVSAVSLAVAA